MPCANNKLEKAKERNNKNNLFIPIPSIKLVKANLEKYFNFFFQIHKMLFLGAYLVASIETSSGFVSGSTTSMSLISKIRRALGGIISWPWYLIPCSP